MCLAVTVSLSIRVAANRDTAVHRENDPNGLAYCAEARVDHVLLADPRIYDRYVTIFGTDQGYRGDGEPFPLPAELALRAARRYIRTYEMLTGRSFEPGTLPAGPRLEQNLRAWLAKSG